jgi:hypothetical protein
VDIHCQVEFCLGHVRNEIGYGIELAESHFQGKFFKYLNVSAFRDNVSDAEKAMDMIITDNCSIVRLQMVSH